MEIICTQLNIGCLSRNAFWGEPPEQPRRKARCSSVLLTRGTEHILVDPGVPYEEMEQLLDCRCGIRIEDVHKVFFTHLHGDHCVDALKYHHAELVTSALEIENLRNKGTKPDLVERLTPVGEMLAPEVTVVALPGHTMGLVGLEFLGRDGKTLIAGDGVMTRDYFDHGVGYHNSVDPELANQTICSIRKRYTYIVPGHDMAFINGVR